MTGSARGKPVPASAGLIDEIVPFGWRHLLLLTAILAAIYAPTFFYPYLLTDETWIVRHGSYAATLPMGRPLFSLFSLVTDRVTRVIGLDVIYGLRLSAIVGLAVAVAGLARWFTRWSAMSRVEAAILALALMTLPAFQIVVANGTQLAWAIACTVTAVNLLMHRTPSAWFASAALILCALMIYQQQALIVFAMLAVPLLQGRSDRKTYEFVFGASVLVAAVTAIYLVGWKLLSRLFIPGHVDMRYGPDAVRLPDLRQLAEFAEARFFQVANLWSVDPGTRWVSLAVLGLMIVAGVALVRSVGWRGLFNLALICGLLVACDVFVIAARAYPSYVTATALSLLVGYWAYRGTVVLVADKYAGSLALCVGAILAFTTVAQEIAIPNWRDMQKLRAGLADPDAENFHIVGIQRGGPMSQEFSWRNATVDAYIFNLTVDIANDMALRGEMSKDRRARLQFTVSGTALENSGGVVKSQPQAGAVVIALDGN